MIPGLYLNPDVPAYVEILYTDVFDWDGELIPVAVYRYIGQTQVHVRPFESLAGWERVVTAL